MKEESLLCIKCGKCYPERMLLQFNSMNPPSVFDEYMPSWALVILLFGVRFNFTGIKH